MTNVKTTEAHLRIAHSIGERVMVSNFSSPRRRVLDLIVRVSLGCGKMTAYIPKQSDFEAAGVGEGHIKAHIDWLIEAAVIIREGQYYSLNKNIDQWRVSRPVKYIPQKLSALVGLNLRTPDPHCGLPLKHTEKGSPGLPEAEVPTYGNGKLPTPVSASPKEIVNKYINEKTSYQVRLAGKPGETNEILAKEDTSPDASCAHRALQRDTQEAAESWTKVLAVLRSQVNAANYDTWLADTRGILCRGKVFMIRVPNAFVAQYLDANLRSLIEKTIIGVTQSRYKVAFEVEGGKSG